MTALDRIRETQRILARAHAEALPQHSQRYRRVVRSGKRAAVILGMAIVAGAATLSPALALPATHLTVQILNADDIYQGYKTVVVSAVDNAGNVDTTYSGTVHFTCTDRFAVLPSDGVLDENTGTGGFGVTLNLSGHQTIKVADTAHPNISGSAGVDVSVNGSPSYLKIEAPLVAIVNQPWSCIVDVFGQYGNGTTEEIFGIDILASDPNAIIPDSHEEMGPGFFDVIFTTLGKQSVTAYSTDPMFSVSSDTIDVDVLPEGSATHYALSTSSPATAGVPFNVAVKAIDDHGNVVPGYSGFVHFTATDLQSVLPADTQLINGTGSFSTTLKTAGPQKIRAMDIAHHGISTLLTVNVAPGNAASLKVEAPASVTAGTAFYAQVKAFDAFNNTATGYSGTIHLTSTDGQAMLPADFTLTNGTKQISAKLKTAGTQTITATDTVDTGLAATTGNISVVAIASKLVITAATTAVAGSPLTFTVTAKDVSGNTATNYTGTAHFTSTDANAILPANAVLVNGVGTFNVTFKTATTVTITATDTMTNTIKGSSGGIVVSAAPASQFTVTAPASTTSGAAFYATVTAKDAYGNLAKSYTGTVHFTSTDLAAVLPANVTLTSGAKQVTVKLKTKPSQSVTATDTVDGSITGTSSAIAVN